MRGTGEQRGYALLAALFITLLATVFASACVAAVSATQGVARADHAGVVADEVAGLALDTVCLELRRRPQRLTWVRSGQVARYDATWRADCVAEAPASLGAWPRVAVTVAARTAAAGRRLALVLELQAEPAAQGFGVAHDVDLRAPLVVSGGGLYSGGSVRGREWLSFAGAASPGAGPPDGVHGGTWPAAAAHALGGIWAAGREVHEGGPADPQFAADTDVHTGAGPVETLTSPPDPCVLTALSELAVPHAGALAGGVLDLSRLPSTPPAPADVTAAEGYVVVLPGDGATEVGVAGVRPAAFCPVVLVVEGDAVVGAGGARTAVGGVVVVRGHLRVAGPTSVTGHVFAERLTVEAPLEIGTPADWRSRQAPGLARPVLVTAGR